MDIYILMIICGSASPFLRRDVAIIQIPINVLYLVKNSILCRQWKIIKKLIKELSLLLIKINNFRDIMKIS